MASSWKKYAISESISCSAWGWKERGEKYLYAFGMIRWRRSIKKEETTEGMTIKNKNKFGEEVANHVILLEISRILVLWLKYPYICRFFFNLGWLIRGGPHNLARRQSLNFLLIYTASRLLQRPSSALLVNICEPLNRISQEVVPLKLPLF